MITDDDRNEMTTFARKLTDGDKYTAEVLVRRAVLALGGMKPPSLWGLFVAVTNASIERDRLAS